MQEAQVVTALVVGAGIGGSACALFLKRRGVRVSLLELIAGRAAMRAARC